MTWLALVNYTAGCELCVDLLYCVAVAVAKLVREGKPSAMA
jgi:hypothetical protein